MEGETADNATLFPATVGEKLRAAREAQNLELSEIASRTRIPQRHLEAIEQGNFASLPSVTYAMGFARSYARAVGADEVALATQLRGELGDRPERPAPPPAYDFDERSRSAPTGIVALGVVFALLVTIGAGIWYGTDWFRGGATAVEETAPTENATAESNTMAIPDAAPLTGGQVTLVAIDTAWVRVADANGKRLYEKEMAKGERYDVPADADRPRARTGRPDRIQVLLNGSQVAPLGTGVKTVDAEVSAAALRARGQPAAPATPPAALVPAGNVTATP